MREDITQETLVLVAISKLGATATSHKIVTFIRSRLPNSKVTNKNVHASIRHLKDNSLIYRKKEEDKQIRYDLTHTGKAKLLDIRYNLASTLFFITDSSQDQPSPVR